MLPPVKQISSVSYYILKARETQSTPNYPPQDGFLIKILECFKVVSWIWEKAHASSGKAYFIRFIPHYEGWERLDFEGQDVDRGRISDIVGAVGAKFKKKSEI